MSRGHAEVAHDYPDWVGPLVAVPPVVFGLVSVWDAGPSAGIVAAAVAIAVVPWLLHAAGREVPMWTFAVWVTAPLALLNLAGHVVGVDLSGESHTQFTLMILVWLVGELAATSSPLLVAAGTIAAVGTAAGRAVVEPSFGHSWMFWAGGTGIALITGFMLRRQQQTLSELRRAQAALAQEAVQGERQRIAREVHDVVAHTLTVTLMHLQAARRALDHDVDAARDALQDAEALGRRSLADIRRTVGLLRDPAEPTETHALPDAGDVDGLLASYRAAGVQLTSHVDLDPAALPPAVGLTLYRLVQESLSNAASHAPGAPVELALEGDASRVTLTVANDLVGGAPSPSQRDGLGLTGMAERVQLLGGRFDAGRRDGRWVVQAVFPTRVSPDVGVPA